MTERDQHLMPTDDRDGRLGELAKIYTLLADMAQRIRGIELSVNELKGSKADTSQTLRVEELNASNDE